MLKNEQVFEKIFWEVAEELNVCDWWKLFDSDDFKIVKDRIRKHFGVNDVYEIEGYDDWVYEMGQEL